MNQFMKLSCLLFLLVPWVAFASETKVAPAVQRSGAAPAPAADHSSPAAVPAPDNINTYLHLKVNSLTKAEAPRVQDKALVLTWKGDITPRYVAAAFKHESYRQKHLFWRNQNGVYFLVMDLASDMPSTLEYRLIVDGLWQSDPTNQNRARNDQGIILNQISLASTDLPAHHGPVQGHFGQVEFAYHGKPGQQVSIVGNFNQWDPFAHFLEEGHPGEYHLKLQLPPGTLLYQFVVGTKAFLDPGNAHTGHDAQGGTFSYFENKLTTPGKVLDAKMAVASAGH